MSNDDFFSESSGTTDLSAVRSARLRRSDGRLEPSIRDVLDEVRALRSEVQKMHERNAVLYGQYCSMIELNARIIEAAGPEAVGHAFTEHMAMVADKRDP